MSDFERVVIWAEVVTKLRNKHGNRARRLVGVTRLSSLVRHACRGVSFFYKEPRSWNRSVWQLCKLLENFYVYLFCSVPRIYFPRPVRWQYHYYNNNGFVEANSISKNALFRLYEKNVTNFRPQIAYRGHVIAGAPTAYTNWRQWD